MSLFGDHLRSLVEINKVNIYALTKQAGLERTAIHKIMSGGRIPSDEYVQKLINALPLSPEETRKLFDSYHISRIGETKYKQRLQVKELIESVAQAENGFGSGQKPATAVTALLGEANIVATGTYAVDNLVKSAILESLTNERKRSIDFVVSNDYQYFYYELLTNYIQNPQTKLRHIVTFAKKHDFIDNTNANITLLSQILPLAFVSSTGYYPHYIYNAASDVGFTQAMPYFILISSEKLVLINRDFNRAALICDRSIVDMYAESFETMLEQSRPLIRYFDSLLEVTDYFISVSTKSSTEPFHWIESEPSLEPLFTKDLIEMAIKQDIPNRDDLIRLIYMNTSFHKENQLQNINVCTTDGISRLIDTGMSYYAPRELVNPVPRKVIKDLLIELHKRAAKKKVKILFANPSKITLLSNTFLAINRLTGLNFLINMSGDTQASKIVCVSLSEDSINEAFMDFVENIEESGFVYSEDESVNTLAKIINEIDA